MNDHRLSEDDREARLEEVLAEYLQASEAGRAPDPAALVATYPEFADDLNEFFQDRELFENAARPFAPCSAAATAGMRHFGEYELIEQIGWGGMGVVYKARHVRLNRTVALKMILAGHFARREDVRRFEIEAENAARLDHPNIVPIYEAGRHRGRSFFTMKLVAGGNLTAQIPRLVKDHRSGARLIATAARAVHHAHQHGILHRDLKTSNILLDDDGQPLIADFGLARMIDGDGGFTLTGAILGTPSYMAPEQASSSKSLTTAVDVYGLGAILYELLTGSPPFHGDTALETLRLVRDEEPSRLSADGKPVNRDLETICLKCLRKQPGERYGSAEAMAEDLERWLGGKPIQARPTGRLHRSVKWVVRRPAVAALIAMSIVSFLGLIVAVIAWPYSVRLRAALGAERYERHRAELALAEARRAREGEKVQRGIAENALANSETLSYLNQIGWAEREWSANNAGRAEQLLDDCRASERRWEWYHLNAYYHSELLSVAHPESVRSVVADFDGKLFLTLSDGGVLRAWDTDSATESRALFKSCRSQTTSVVAVAFSIKGSRWAAAYKDGVIRAWDRSGNQVAKLTGEPATCLALSPDAQMLAFGTTSKLVRVWDLHNQSLAHSFGGHPQQHINAVTFSPDCRRLASCSGTLAPLREGQIEIWDLKSGSNLSFAEKTGVVWAVAFTSSDRLASAHGDGTIKLWDLIGGQVLKTLRGHSDSVLCIAANREGTRIASAGADRTVRVWDAEAGEQLLVCGAHRGDVNAVAFLPDGQRLITGGADNTAKIWQTQSNPAAQVFRDFGRASDVAFSADGTRLAVAASNGLSLLDRTDGHSLFRVEGNLRTRLSYGRDGSEVAVDRSVYNAITGHKDAVAPAGHALAYGIAFSPDGLELASGSGSSLAVGTQNGVLIWNGRSGKQVKYLTEDGLRAVFAVAFSPNNRLVASGGGKWSGGFGEIKLWDRQTGHVVRTMNSNPFCVWSLSFSKDGSRLASGCGLEQPNGVSGMATPTRPGEPRGRVQVWDVGTGRELFSWASPECVFCVAFSPDGSRVASAGGAKSSRGPSDVTLWDTAQGRQAFRLQGHQDAIYGLAFSADGQSLASASVDGTVRVWRAFPLPAGK